MPATNIRELISGKRISWVEETGWFGVPNGLNPSAILGRDGMRIPTQTMSPTFRRIPLIQRKRAIGLSQACVTRKDGYTDLGSAGIRLPISVARAKVCTRPAAFCGEI